MRSSVARSLSRKAIILWRARSRTNHTPISAPDVLRGIDPAHTPVIQYPLDKDLKQVWGYSYLNYVCVLLIYLVVRERLFLKFFNNRFIKTF